MTYSVLQFVLRNIFQVLFVCWLLNVIVVFTCLQHTFPAFDLHRVHLPSLEVFKSFLTLLFSIQCVSIISWMFLLRLNAAISSFLKLFLRFSFISKIFQFFLMVLVIFGRSRLYVITRGILSDFFHVSFSVIRSILLRSLILSRCSLINHEWYPCFMKLFYISLKLLFKSTWFALIPLIYIYV